MNVKMMAAAVLLVLSGCSQCVVTCERVRDQLIRDFGVLPTTINCSDPGWRQASSCEACNALLQRDYGVVANTCVDDSLHAP